MVSPTAYEQTPLPSAFDAFGENGVDLPRMPSARELLERIEDGNDDARARESETIALLLRQKLVDERSPMRTMSPDYVAALPKSMIEKLRITPAEQEEILFHYASTSSIPQTVAASGYGRTKVHAVVYAPENQAPLEALRNAMRVTVIRKIEETQLILLNELQDPDKLNSATLTQISSILQDVSEISMNLRSASQTQGGPAIDPTSVFTGDELEYMAFLRKRLNAGSPAPAQFYSPDPPAPNDDIEAHFVVGNSVEVDTASPPSAPSADRGGPPDFSAEGAEGREEHGLTDANSISY